MLARYIVIAVRHTFEQVLCASASTSYVIRGRGTASSMGENFSWSKADAFYLPGGIPTRFVAQEPSVIVQVGNEPALAYLRAIL